MQRNLLLKLSVILSSLYFASCGGGLNVRPCISDPTTSQYTCKDSSGNVTNVGYYNSSGYAAYTPVDEQTLDNYCAARNQSGTQAPDFTACITDISSTGLDCYEMACTLNVEQNGISCVPVGPKQLVLWTNSNDYIAFSPADNTALLDYCNIKITL
jgi:hypothetical protein